MTPLRPPYTIRRLMIRILTSLFLLSVASTTHAIGSGSSKAPCLMITLNRMIDERSESPKIANFEDLFDAFANGLIPDLNQRDQRDAFEFYRKIRFGNPNTALKADSLEEVIQALRKNPELNKEPFRDYTLSIRGKTYPVTKELAQFLDSQVVSARQSRSNLFHIDANSGYWKKVFQYEGLKIESLPHDLTPEQKNAFRDKNQRVKLEDQFRWIKFLDSKIRPELRKRILDLTIATEVRATILFEILSQHRQNLSEKFPGDLKKLRPVSQAMIDLIHTIGYHDPEVIQALKDQDGVKRIQAYRKILDERDRFAMDLGFSHHFNEVIQKIGLPVGISVPSGVPSARQTAETLDRIEQDVIEQSHVSKSSDVLSRTLRVRQLSLVESPFRSCLGGSDCSSRTYLTRALDPNYHYFTLTDEAGMSSGQITIVLGDANSGKVAFIDKIQNVPHVYLPQMIEAVRRSVAEKGYELTIPHDLGDHNGLSNDEATRKFVEKYIRRDLRTFIRDFKPHSHSYSFPNNFSRAEQGLSLHRVLPLEFLGEKEIHAGKLPHYWRIDRESVKAGENEFNLNELISASYLLKNSPLMVDRFKYLAAMQTVRNSGFPIDPEWEVTLERWISHSQEPFSLRKQVLLTQWSQQSKPLLDLLSYFNHAEKIQLLQNLIDTPQYQSKILGEKKELLNYSIILRKNAKLRSLLLDADLGYVFQGIRSEVEKVLSASDISDEKAYELIHLLKSHFLSLDIEKALRILQLVQNSSLEKLFIDQFVTTYGSGYQTEVGLIQVLARSLSESKTRGSIADSFARKLLNWVENKYPAKKNVIQAFEEILASQKTGSQTLDFDQAVLSWVQSSRGDSRVKSNFILGHLRDKKPYDVLLQQRQAEFIRQIDQMTHLHLFEKIDSSEGKNVQQGKIASFEFRPFKLDQSFELQATPVTQLQWSMVMGDNPSYFKTDGTSFKIHDQEIVMHPNRRVENVSWLEVQEFIQKLNRLDPIYDYRLPTRAEWEYVINRGMHPPDLLGYEADELNIPGLIMGDMMLYTQDVANQYPNAFGIYDTRGKFWEWLQDEAQFKMNRVLVAGCQGIGQGSARIDGNCFLPIASGSEKERFNTVGFRLVRVLKAPQT